MFSSNLKLFTLLVLVLAAYADDASNEHGVKHLSSENDRDIKGTHLDDNNLDDRTLIRPTTLTPAQIFKPTPSSKPVVIPAPPQIEEQPPPALTTPKPIVVLPPPAPPQAICGRKRNCYQWFEEEWELILEGYKRCDLRDERRARRYCCTP